MARAVLHLPRVGIFEMATLPEIIGAFVSDAFELGGTHGGSIAGVAIGRYLRLRAERARDILFEELRRAHISDAQLASEDDAIAVIVRYLRAAREGAARLNIRLLAKGIAGQIQLGRLVADEFLQYADALGSLSRDEIVVIATLYRMSLAFRHLGAENPAEVHKYANVWAPTWRELVKAGMLPEIIATAAARAQRSGLICASTAASDLSEAGGPGYRVSPWLVDLCKTLDFEDALRREASGSV
jgi:hypothetical protein